MSSAENFTQIARHYFNVSDEMPEMGIDDDQVIQEALFPEDCQKSEMSGLERAVYEDTEDAHLRDDQSKFIKSAPDNIPYPIQLKESESLTVSAEDNDVPTYSGPSADGANQIPLAKEDLNVRQNYSTTL